MSDQERMWQPMYAISCPACGHDAECSPSIFHRMGFFELGGASCPECKEMMQIHFQPDTNTMTALPLDSKESEHAS